MNVNLTTRTDPAGTKIPDSKLARKIMKLLLGNSGRRAPRTEVRSRTVLCGRDVPRRELCCGQYSNTEREAVVHAHARNAHFKEDIDQALYEGSSTSRRRPRQWVGRRGRG